MYVNLLPVSFTRRLTLCRQAWKWGLAVGATLVAAGGLLTAQYLAVVSARQEQAITALKSKDLHAVEADIERLAAEAKSLQSTISSLQDARPEDRTLALLGIASTSANELSGKVQLKQLTTQMAPAATSVPAPNAPLPSPHPGVASRTTPSAAAPVQTPNDCILEGAAEDAAAIARFVEALRETNVFARVDLTATTEAATSSGTKRQFRIDCKF